MSKKQSKRELFLELAKPDKDGFSREVSIDEFVGKYSVLRFGNGADWARSDGSLAKKYNVRRRRNGRKVAGISLQGFNKNPISKPIPPHIKKAIRAESCVVLGINHNVQTDHKDGRRDDPRMTDASKVKKDDFQPLSGAVNLAKRQHCKECRRTNKRFDAKKLGYPISQIPGKGNGTYSGSCVGCYWHDILEFRKALQSK